MSKKPKRNLTATYNSSHHIIIVFSLIFQVHIHNLRKDTEYGLYDDLCKIKEFQFEMAELMKDPEDDFWGEKQFRRYSKII